MVETRRRLVEVLRLQGGRTVEELATALRVTRTAVTTQLAALRAEGFVARAGLRPGPRRPSIVYALTPAADRLFPKAYEEFSSALMAAVRQGDLKEALRKIGSAWIARDLPAVQDLHGRPRFERARAILTERGFMPALAAEDGTLVLREYNCPVMRLAVEHPEVCEMVHGWLETLFGTRLTRTRCLRRGDPYSAYLLAARQRPAPKPRRG